MCASPLHTTHQQQCVGNLAAWGEIEWGGRMPTCLGKHLWKISMHVLNKTRTSQGTQYLGSNLEWAGSLGSTCFEVWVIWADMPCWLASSYRAHTHTQTRDLRFSSRQSYHYNLFTALFTLQFFTLWSLTTECLILECLSLVRKQVAYREAHWKSIIRTMEHPCTATNHYTGKRIQAFYGNELC